jgi:hypothetical protein
VEAPPGEDPHGGIEDLTALLLGACLPVARCD